MDQTAKSYTVKEVAELARVSVRTLHFYHEIGLLLPAFVGANGYRYYEAAELSRLQDILFYRELGLSLEAIAAILNAPGYDRISALKSHRHQLEAQAERMAQLIATIDRTIQSIEEKTKMKPEEMYTGITPEKQAEHEAYLINRFGDCVVPKIAESKERRRHWKAEDYQGAVAENETLNRELVKVMVEGLDPADPRVQDVVRQHYEFVCKHWTPNRSAYLGLGEMYLDHPEFRAHYAAFHPDLPIFLVRAMRIFAEQRLSD